MDQATRDLTGLVAARLFLHSLLYSVSRMGIKWELAHRTSPIRNGRTQDRLQTGACFLWCLCRDVVRGYTGLEVFMIRHGFGIHLPVILWVFTLCSY